MEGLLDLARQASENAYAPYSHLRVGAAVVGGSGAIYTGANVENAAFGSTLCAEAVAIGSAVSAGETALVTVAVASPDLAHITPCGQCRQRMAEFGVEQVVLEGENGAEAVVPFERMLPGSFQDWRGSSSS
jgi:cytidine deaminase